MAAPALTARVQPPGVKLKYGFRFLIALSLDPNIDLWEIEANPPGVDNGDPIENDTQWNQFWRIKRARALNDLTPLNMKCAYDPAVLDQVINVVGLEQSITFHFPDGSTWRFYGYLRSFQPDTMSETQFVTAQVVFQPTNWDSTNDLQVGPVTTYVSGT